MFDADFTFENTLWRYASEKASWFFITVPEDISAQVKMLSGRRNGFGSVKVDAKIGDSEWQTSVFPDKKSGCYFLPVKAAIRRAEGLNLEDPIQVTLTVKTGL